MRPSRVPPPNASDRAIRIALLCLLAGAPALLDISPAHAQPQQVGLVPQAAEITIRSYALGMFPITGRFTRFAGSVTYDPVGPAACDVALKVEVASLAMPDETMRQNALATDFLDAARYPELGFRGRCAGGVVQGVLSMHGVSRPLDLALAADGAGVVATAEIHRADWGITGSAVMVGPNIVIRISLALPPAGRTWLAHALVAAPAR